MSGESREYASDGRIDDTSGAFGIVGTELDPYAPQPVHQQPCSSSLRDARSKRPVAAHHQSSLRQVVAPLDERRTSKFEHDSDRQVSGSGDRRGLSQRSLSPNVRRQYGGDLEPPESSLNPRRSPVNFRQASRSESSPTQYKHVQPALCDFRSSPKARTSSYSRQTISARASAGRDPARNPSDRRLDSTEAFVDHHGTSSWDRRSNMLSEHRQRNSKRPRSSKREEKWRFNRKRGALGGGKFFKPHRPVDEEVELWCKVCSRGFQDANAKASHNLSKAHRQAVEDSTRGDDSDSSDSGANKVEKNVSHFVEKSAVDPDMVKATIVSGEHENAPPAFKEWANRSIAAAKARNDPQILNAVLREIAEELTVQNVYGTINFQNWKNRENATGKHFMDTEPTKVKIPIFEVPDKSEPELSVATEDLRDQCPSANSGRTKGGLESSLDCTLPSVDPRANRTPSVSGTLIQESRAVAKSENRTEKSPSSLGTVLAHAPPVTISAAVPLIVPLTVPVAEKQSPLSRSVRVESGKARDSKEKNVPTSGSVNQRKRYSPKCTTRRASKIYESCRGSQKSFQAFVDGDYRWSIRKHSASESSSTRNKLDENNFAETDLQSEIDSLSEEFKGNYVFTDFARKVESLITKLDVGNVSHLDILRRSYELLIDATLPEDRFEDLPGLCGRLVDIHNVLSDCRLDRRDEVMAYFLMSLVIKPSGSAAERPARAGLQATLRRQLLPGKLAKSVLPGYRKGPNTCLAKTVLLSLLNGNYAKFFELYIQAGVSDYCDGRIQMFMDSFTTYMRSKAIKVLYEAVDQPRKYPLQALMRQLAWYNQASPDTPVPWRTSDACEFIERTGTRVDVKSDEGVACDDGSNIYMACYDPRYVCEVEALYGAVDPILVSTSNRAGD